MPNKPIAPNPAIAFRLDSGSMGAESVSRDVGHEYADFLENPTAGLGPSAALASSLAWQFVAGWPSEIRGPGCRRRGATEIQDRIGDPLSGTSLLRSWKSERIVLNIPWPNKPAAGQRRSSLLVRFGHRWPGVPERIVWNALACAPYGTRRS